MDFYFDFVSPYGYFAACKIDALAKQYGRSIEWHPLLLGAVFKTTGAVPLTTIPLRGEYTRMETARTARFHGIPFQFPVAFPIATQAAARATYVIRDQHGADAAGQFTKAVYEAYFNRAIHIGEPANVLQIATECGFDAAAIGAAIQTEQYKERLKQEIEQAMARGVFGSPFIIVDDEPFWGFDHFYQVEAFLKSGKF